MFLFTDEDLFTMYWHFNDWTYKDKNRCYYGNDNVDDLVLQGKDVHIKIRFDVKTNNTIAVV